MRSGKRSAAGAVFVLALLMMGSAHAGKVGKGQPHDDEHPGNGGGAQVAIDAQGKLRTPTRDESAVLLQQMARYLDQSAAGLKMRIAPNGTRTVDLEDRFQEVAIAKIHDGKIDFACVGTLDEAKAFLEGGASVKPHAHASVARSPRGVVALEEK
jgi:hypothetical protein